MRTLRSPMFRKGGFANEGIMHGLDRKGYSNGSEWENTTQSEWEDIAKTYDMVGTLSTDYTDPENIEKWSQPINYDFFNWLASDKVKAREEKIKQEEALAAAVAAAAAGKIPGRGDEEMMGTGEWFAAQKDNKKDNALEKIIAKKETLNEKNKRYLSMMAPHMQKRMIADAWGAASESFEKSTGNTKQDIARALGAAGRAMSDTRGIADKVSMLTLQGEIMKDVEAAKPKKLSNYEYLAQLSKTDPATFNKLMKSGDTTAEMAIEFSKKYQTRGAERGLGDAYQLKASSANAKNYGGTLDLTTDGKTADFEKMVKGQIYYNYLDLNFYAIGDDGKPTQVAKPDYLK